MKSFLFISLATLLTSCGILIPIPYSDSQYQRTTSAQIGCHSEEIKISKQDNSITVWNNPDLVVTWEAECKGRKFICNKNGEDTKCTEELASK